MTNEQAKEVAKEIHEASHYEWLRQGNLSVEHIASIIQRHCGESELAAIKSPVVKVLAGWGPK